MLRLRHPPRRRAPPRTAPIVFAALVALACLPVACKAGRKPVIVLAAASLARAFAELEEQIEQRTPQLDVQLEISGSQTACRKVAELNRRADVVASADHRLIDTILRPRHARFTLRFATNEIVLAHLEHSRHTETVTADNWPEVLRRPGVRLAMVDPDLAPIGYRTLLVWQLAARYHGHTGLADELRRRCPPARVLPHETELLRMLQARAIDYAFVYRSTAEEHNLKVVRLPPAYNLGAADRAREYAQQTVTVRTGANARRTLPGAPVTYGLTIPRDPPNIQGAIHFVAALLGESGRRALRRTGFVPLVPARADSADELPPPLRDRVTRETPK